MLDVTSQDSIDKAVEVIANKLSDLDITLVALVNNAGVASYSSAEFADIDEARATFDVNVFGCMRMLKACVPMLRAAGPGARIVNVSSMAGFIATPGEKPPPPSGSAPFLFRSILKEGLAEC